MDEEGRRVAAVNGLVARVGSNLPRLGDDGELGATAGRTTSGGSGCRRGPCRGSGSRASSQGGRSRGSSRVSIKSDRRPSPPGS
jgi:hypothetical protein